MFSKKWLENCAASLTTYETPAKGGDMRSFRPGYGKDEDFGIIDDDMEKVVEKKTSTKKRDWKEFLVKLNKRRGKK